MSVKVSHAHQSGPKTLRKGGAEYAYAPIRLKGVLDRNGITAGVLAARVKQLNGKPISRTALTFILNFDLFPAQTPAQSIRDQVNAYLRSRDVPEDEIATAWEVSEELQDTTAQRYDRSQHPKTMKAPEPLELPDIPEKEMLSPATKKHFQLFRDPFIDEIRGPEDLYMAADQRYIREAMYQNAKNGGFIAVIGESGAGKTTLRLDLIERVTKEALQILFIQPRLIDKSHLTARMICEAILADLAPSERMPQSQERLTRKVEKTLIESYKAGNRHVLVIEEAQDLEPRALKHLKRFYELQAGYQKLMSIILVGQPELRHLLDERQHSDLREVIRRCEQAELAPLDANVKEYLGHKMKRAGKELGDVFGPDAFDAIVARLTRDSSRGKVSMVYPLVVNNLATKAMNLASSIGEKVVTAEIVKGV